LSQIDIIISVRESHQGKVLTIEGVLVPSPREQYLVRTEHEGVCSLCSIGVDVKHTDVLILSQFLRADGCMLPRRITGLCKNQQKRISILVQMAQKAETCKRVLKQWDALIEYLMKLSSQN
ncbi:unnamed protein product, partial [Timema podura]|nr:unnamed protein product [Timema podura]